MPAGAVEFDVTNSGTGSVSEAELRTSDKAHILGEQENLTPGLSGGFSLTIQPGTYNINCPGASPADDPVLRNEYIHHTGSAVFAVPPGLRRGQHYGDALFG